MARGDPVAARPHVDPLVATGLAALVVQAVILSSGAARAAMVDPIAPGMMVLALLCWWRTHGAAPAGASAGHWRWRAAMAGWLLWALQWSVNLVEQPIFAGDQRIAGVLILLHRVAFIVALVPIASPEDPRLFRLLDAMLGIVFASVLTLLSWPELLNGQLSDPDRRFLYLGYAAMPALATVSMVAQRSAAIRPLTRALCVALVLYGMHAIAMRELFIAGVIDNETSVFLLGDLAFVAYLALLPVDAARTAVNGAPADTGVLAPLVPLLLAALVIALAFVLSRVVPGAGIVVALAALAIYAARTTLTENLHHAAQRARLAAMVDMMHEIRSPLGAVALNAGLLRRRAPLDAREERICAAIETGCSSVVTLLEDVLSLERLEAGLVPPVIATHDLAAIARDTMALLEVRWRAAGIAVHGPDAPFPAMVDRAAVHRILLNLIGNAVRFTPAGGEVRVTLARGRDGGGVVMSVADSGVGMTEDARARLFQRFAVVGKPLHGPRGTGLGLSISLALVRTMGGTIEVESRVGRGTLMKIVLPEALRAECP